MKNEIVLSELKFEADVQPAKIEIFEYERLESAINEVAERYEGLVFEASDIKSAKEIRTKLRKLNSSIDERRKAIKSVINEPLNEFESKIKKLTTKLDGVIEPISVGISAAEEGEKQQRIDEMNRYINDLVVAENIEFGQIEINKKWYNKSAKKSDVKKEVEYQIKELIDIARRINEDKTAVNSFAESKGIDANGYLILVEEGYSISDIFARIEKEVLRREELSKINEEKQEKERIRIEEQKMRDLDIKKNQESAKEVNVNVDKTQGEYQAEPFFEQQIITEVIEVTATLDQLKLLNNFMVENKIAVSSHACERFENYGL